MPTIKRCPKCNGKSVPLQKMALLEMKRASLKYIETYQPYRCKRCKHEWREK